ncbi:hypothetical protein M378DRAFT_1039248 [Amanita muscaria Koide BX008]|uniref:Uncharacterized protein n=1 Tax=Amanita muscaria (strain Koide BX008) TaxID=946122 RepID=A0A0C2SQ72_AMAMK|nr:hypothetical protein M378DRAFT_1039248 [Amanita muscaria Koide BX008]
MGLVTARMHNYRNNFAKRAMGSIELLIKKHKKELDTKEKIAELIAYYLHNEPVQPDSDVCTSAFHWLEWGEDPAGRKGFGLNQLVLRTFALAHLSHLNDIDDFTVDKPVGALIYSMQAIGCMLEHWKSGEKSENKPPAFSSDNFGDKWVEDAKGAVGIRGKVLKKRILVRRATIFVESLKDLKDERWDEIFLRACRFVVLQPNKERDRSSSTTEIEDETRDEDPDADFRMVLD